jgi:hypothetical protein
LVGLLIGRLPGLGPATHVLGVRHGLQVVRVRAARVAAQVVDFQAGRDLADLQQVGHAVDVHGLAGAGLHAAVAVGVRAARPDHAAIRLRGQPREHAFP